MRDTFWKIWTKTNNEKNAISVFRRVLKEMNREAQIISIEPYPKINGHVLRFFIELESETWNDGIVDCFRLGQTIASRWSLCGNAISDPSGYSSKVSDSSVEMSEWSFR